MRASGLILVQGENIKEESLMIGLSNAKQLIVGSAMEFGTIIHIAANSQEDLQNAYFEFSKIKGVTSIVPLAIQNQKQEN